MAHLSHREQGNTASLELEPGAHLARAVGFATDFARAVRPNPGGAEAVRGHLVSALRSGGFDFCLAAKDGAGAGDAGADGGAKGRGSGGRSGRSSDRHQRPAPAPAPSHPRAPGLGGGLGSGAGRGPGQFPSGDFEGDLLPGGGAGAGGLLGPEHPMFGGGGSGFDDPRPGPRFGPGLGPGTLPPGVPPGARFDPYGPGVPVPRMPNPRHGGPRGPPRGPAPFAGPSPDHLRPPGWGGGNSAPDNMYG